MGRDQAAREKWVTGGSVWGHLISKSRGFTVQEPVRTVSTAELESGTHSLIEAGDNRPECQGTVGSEVAVRRCFTTTEIQFRLTRFCLVSAAVVLELSVVSH